MCIDNHQESIAIKQHLLERGRGTHMSFQDHLEDVRTRRREDFSGGLDCRAVVGILDVRKRAATAPADKSFGPAGIADELFKQAPEHMSRLYDPLAIESSLSLDVPLQWQGGDNAMLVKNPIGDVHNLGNQRSIALADREPKIVGSELRSRVMPLLQESVVTTQWGDGFGAASCEMAHLALESFTNLAKLRGLSAVRVFVDVVQAYPSLVVALALPLPIRMQATKQLPVDTGFREDEALEVIAEQHDLTEWERFRNTSGGPWLLSRRLNGPLRTSRRELQLRW